MQENCLFYENGRNVPELGTSRLKENVAVTHHFFEKELVVIKKSM